MLAFLRCAAAAAPDGKTMAMDDWHALEITGVAGEASGPLYLRVQAGDLDGDGKADDAVVKLVCAAGKVTDASYVVAPRDMATGMATGKRQYLCKRYPAVVDLALRGFAPRAVRRLFERRLHHYEMRDVVDVDPPRDAIGVPLMSGAFVLVRRDAIDRTGGFDPRFFLYFEDFDWSVRLNAVARNAYVPSVNIIHHGGGAAGKGLRHVLWFIGSGLRFYAKHGWRWI